MGAMKQAFTCGPFAQGGQVPMSELFAIAADIGLKGVDVCGPYDIKDVVKEGPLGDGGEIGGGEWLLGFG